MDFFSDMAKQNEIDAKILKDNIIKDVIYNRYGHWVANSYIDEKLWLIYSDFGNAAYCWGSIGSKSLKEFIARTDEHYLTKKLIDSEQRTEVDWEATKLSIKKWILRERRGNDLTKENARDRWDDIYWCDCLEDYQVQDDVVDDLYEFIVHKESSHSKALREEVIRPLKELFVKQIQENV
jgi:hypothetical protein